MCAHLFLTYKFMYFVALEKIIFRSFDVIPIYKAAKLTEVTPIKTDNINRKIVCGRNITTMTEGITATPNTKTDGIIA